MKKKFDAIVVGAGPAGNAAAYTMAKSGLNVLQLERGEYPGSKNVQGAILYSDALERIIPDFRDDAPLERHIIEQRMWMLDETSFVGMQYRSEEFNEERPNRYTIIRAEFDKWFSRRVREAGAVVLCETTVTGLIKDKHGKVVGVHTDRADGDLLADVVVLGEGVNGLVGQSAGLRPELKPKEVALAVKEMHFMPQDVLENRFNLKGDEGVVIEAMGTVSPGLSGMGFIYTNKESISVGIGTPRFRFHRVGRDTVQHDRGVQEPSQHQAAAGRIGSEGILGAPDSRGRVQSDPGGVRRRLGHRRRCRPVRELGAS